MYIVHYELNLEEKAQWIDWMNKKATCALCTWCACIKTTKTGYIIRMKGKRSIEKVNGIRFHCYMLVAWIVELSFCVYAFDIHTQKRKRYALSRMPIVLPLSISHTFYTCKHTTPILTISFNFYCCWCWLSCPSTRISIT